MAESTPFSVDDIYPAVAENLKKGSAKEIKAAVNILLDIAPVLLQHTSYEPWGELISEAITLQEEPKVQKGMSKFELMTLHGRLYLRRRQEQEAYQAFKTLLDATWETDLTGYYQIEAYIGLLQTYVRFPVPELEDPNLIDALVSAGIHSASQEQRWRLNSSLTAFALAQGRYWLCIETGRRAYEEWKAEGNALEMATVAHYISQAYRSVNDPISGNEWHENAEGAFSRIKSSKSRPVLAYNWGYQELFNQQYAEAEYWLRAAMDDYGKIKDLHGKFISAHAAAIAMAYRGDDLQGAVKLLNGAVQYWKRYGHPMHIAHAHHTYGFLYHRMNDDETALHYLRHGLKLFDALPSTDFTVQVTTRINDLIRMIENGDDTGGLAPRTGK